MNKDIKDFTDLELVKLQQQAYQILMQQQGNLQIIAQEVERREGLKVTPPPKDSGDPPIKERNAEGKS